MSNNQQLDSICNGNQLGQGEDAVIINVTIIVMGLLYIVIGMWIIIKIFETVPSLRDMQYTNAWLLVWCSIFMISVSAFMSQVVHVQRYSQRASPSFWFNGLLPDTFSAAIIVILVGMVKNIVFGFLDNAGLFFGSNQLDEVFEQLPGAADANVFAGQGNTYSDFVGAFLGTFCGQIMSDLTDIETAPFWTECIGIVVGCLFGILIPKLIMGSNSDFHGINRINAKQTLVGNLDKDEMKELLKGQVDFVQYKIDLLFDKIDADKSNSLDYNEIKNFLNAALEDHDVESVIQNSFGTKDHQSREDFKTIFISLAKELCKEKQGQDGNYQEYTMRKKANNSKIHQNGNDHKHEDTKSDQNKVADLNDIKLK